MLTYTYRKPPNLPPSQTKRYNVFRTKELTAEESRQLTWRRLAYNDAVASIRAHLKSEQNQDSPLGRKMVQLQRAEEREFLAVLRENDEMNKKTEQRRLEKEAEFITEFDENLEREIEEYKRTSEEQIAIRRAEVKKAIAESANFITEDNLLEKLNEALDTPLELEYAIDSTGEVFNNPTPVAYLETTPLASKAQHKKSLFSDELEKSSQKNKDKMLPEAETDLKTDHLDTN